MYKVVFFDHRVEFGCETFVACAISNRLFKFVEKFAIYTDLNHRVGAWGITQLCEYIRLRQRASTIAAIQELERAVGTNRRAIDQVLY